MANHYTYSQGDILNTDFEENYHDFLEMVRSAFFKTNFTYFEKFITFHTRTIVT